MPSSADAARRPAPAGMPAAVSGVETETGACATGARPASGDAAVQGGALVVAGPSSAVSGSVIPSMLSVVPTASATSAEVTGGSEITGGTSGGSPGTVGDPCVPKTPWVTWLVTWVAICVIWFVIWLTCVTGPSSPGLEIRIAMFVLIC
ncbi:MAG TPA: hypothetical protein VFM41_08755 [Gaiella sp.]|nr:hypothetical protein [Gaiella sp.]